MGLIEKGAFREYYFRLSVVVRRYLEDRTGVDAMERTTTEVARDLGATNLDASHVAEVEGFLSGADLVKFAKHRPSAKASAEAADQIRSLMRRIDALVLRTAEPAPAGAGSPRDGELDLQPAAPQKATRYNCNNICAIHC